MSEIKNSGLDQYGAEPSAQQQLALKGSITWMCSIPLRCDAHLLNEVNGWLQVQTKVDEFPFNAFALVLFLFNNEHCVVEQLLKLLVRVVDAQLLERVHLCQHQQHTRQSVMCRNSRCNSSIQVNISTSNITAHHRGPKQKLQASYRTRSLKCILCDALLCECCHIFHRQVWYRALLCAMVSIRSSGIILTLAYLCAKFRFFCGFHCWASLWRKMAYSLTHPCTQSPSLFDAPGTEPFTSEQATWLIVMEVRRESFQLVTERRHYNARHIFHRRVWYRALLCAMVSIQSSGIILIP